jgi:hypothetical protein
MGLTEDCGLVLGDSCLSSSYVLSVIRTRELAQAKLAEAIEREAMKEAAKAAEDPQSSMQTEPTSVVPPSQRSPQAVCPGGEAGDLENITVASLSKKKKRKGPVVPLPPRTNLRSTLARQARAFLAVSQ